MAISLTGAELSHLDTAISRIDATDAWVVTEGGSTIHCDVALMNEEVADSPAGITSAQSFQILESHRAAGSLARSR